MNRDEKVREMEREEAIRELKCLVSLNDLAPRTPNDSLLNKNLSKRKKALEIAIEAISQLNALDKPRIDEGKLTEFLQKQCVMIDKTMQQELGGYIKKYSAKKLACVIAEKASEILR